jgi:TolA-binding protein
MSDNSPPRYCNISDNSPPNGNSPDGLQKKLDALNKQVSELEGENKEKSTRLIQLDKKQEELNALYQRLGLVEGILGVIVLCILAFVFL